MPLPNSHSNCKATSKESQASENFSQKTWPENAFGIIGNAPTLIKILALIIFVLFFWVVSLGMEVISTWTGDRYVGGICMVFGIIGVISSDFDQLDCSMISRPVKIRTEYILKHVPTADSENIIVAAVVI